MFITTVRDGVSGQQDDARMCLALAVTAAKLGAAVSNYTEVTQLVKTSDSIVSGVRVKDRLTGRLRLQASDDSRLQTLQLDSGIVLTKFISKFKTVYCSNVVKIAIGIERNLFFSS